jgi:hypothetical protein
VEFAVSRYSLSHLSDRALLSDLKALVIRDRATTAELLAHIAEVDERRLYAPAGFPSMHAYCVGELALSEDATSKRIHAARAAREFPALFQAVADGRLHLTGLCLLAPHLTPGNADSLLASAAGKTKAEIEHLIAERFPRSEGLALVGTLGPSGPMEPQNAPAHVGGAAEGSPRAEAPGGKHAPAHVEPRVPSRVTPIAPQRYFVQFTMSQEMHDKLRYAQALLGHQIPSGDEAQVLERVLDLAIGQLEKRKFAATSRPGPRRPSKNPRNIPAHVRRTVHERDGGRCTFVSESGRRCEATTMLEFDHLNPVARGGKATVENLRLRCRAHNQHAAECAFGAEFMRRKRQAAQAAAACARAKESAAEVLPWLQALGIRADRARRAAERCEAIPDAPLEERIKLALRCFGRRTETAAPQAKGPSSLGPWLPR